MSAHGYTPKDLQLQWDIDFKNKHPWLYAVQVFFGWRKPLK